METKVLLSADSTCDLGEDIKKRYKVEFYPLHIILEEKDYLDNVTIQTEDIYRAYYDKKVLPQTAAVNTAEYIEFFRTWIDQGYEIVHINLGSGLSSSYQNACIAAKELGHVYPVDSCNLSTGTGLLVIQAAQLIHQGLDAGTVSERLKQLIKNIHASFIVDTLEFLHAGGRCSTIAKLGANLLNIKPCIEVSTEDGSMKMGKLYRGKLERCLVNYTIEKLNAYQNIDYDRIFITHSGIEESCIDAVKKNIEETAEFKEILITKASCTISSHCGPNTLGILFMTK